MKYKDLEHEELKKRIINIKGEELFQRADKLFRESDEWRSLSKFKQWMMSPDEELSKIKKIYSRLLDEEIKEAEESK